MRSWIPRLQPSSSPNSIDGKRPNRRWLVLVTSVFLIGSGWVATNSTAFSGDDEEPNPDIAVLIVDAPKNGKAGIVGKLIPDQKAFVGTPETHINLDFAFADVIPPNDFAGSEYEIVLNKKPKYVGAEVKGRFLILTWKKTGKSEIRVRAKWGKEDFADTKFQAQVWKANYFVMIYTVVGGLGIFLLGMKNMSEGLQAVAGSGLRKMVALVTANRFLAIGVGTTATCIVQSSSVTTVMVVGFVNSGFMTLTQAIGVIMGANIGTTITGWILALKIGKYGLAILGIAVFGYVFSKRDNLRYFSMFLMGLGMVFFGLEIMKDGFTMIKELPGFERGFLLFDANDHIGVIKCALVGCVLTFIVQSSSATLGITIGLAQIGVIPFETAAALVLGENIGTTITAGLAAIGTTTNAKRAAAFHVIFNLVGVFWIIAVFFPYMDAVKFVVGVDPATGVIDPTRGIAATHTGFNVLNTLLFLGFIPWIARALERALPDKSRKETPHLTSLDIRLVETPVMAIEQSRGEILRMGDGCEKMMVWLKELTPQDPMDKKLAEKLFHREEVLDSVQDEVVAFMTNLLAGHAPHKIIEEGRCQLRMADEYESISDYVASILRFHVRLNEQGHQIDERHRKELLELHDEVDTFLQFVTRGYRNRQPEPTTKVHTKADEIKYRIRRLRQEHIEFLSEEKSDPFKSVAYTAMLNSYQRVRDHALNIGEAVAGEK